MNKGNFEDHPGFSQSSCPLRITIRAAPYGTSHNGYACSDTGGHCMKSEYCKERVAAFEAEPK